jgi:P-type E1-E2 ATPase
MPDILTYVLFAQLSTSDSLSHLDASAKGLTTHEAHFRGKRYGLNVLRVRTSGWWHILVRQFQSPFVYLLVAAALLALSLRGFIDGALILLFVFINASLGFFQEYRSEHALKILRRYTAAHAQTVRDGTRTSVSVDALVPGDIVHLQPGDIVPADLRLLETKNLTIDESNITGESEPMRKDVEKLRDENIPIHQAQNIAFSGMHVVGGHGHGVVIATGVNSYIGSVAKLTVGMTHVSGFEKGMRKFSTLVLRLVGITLVLVIVANVAIKGPTVHIADLIIFSIALATAVIPEALPLVIT